MKKTFVVSIVFLSALVGAQRWAAAQYVKPASPDPDAIERYNLVSTEARRRYFAAAMSNLTPEQLRIFWEVYAEYEKEKDAIAMARTDLASKYLDGYTNEGGPQDAELTQLVYDAGDLQKKNTDLRLKLLHDLQPEAERKSSRSLRLDRRLSNYRRPYEPLRQAPAAGERSWAVRARSGSVVDRREDRGNGDALRP